MHCTVMYGMLDKQSIEIAVSENTRVIPFFFSLQFKHPQFSFHPFFPLISSNFFALILENFSVDEILHEC